MRGLEMIVPNLEHLPKGQVRIGSMPGQICRCHAERMFGPEYGRPRSCHASVDLGDLLVGRQQPLDEQSPRIMRKVPSRLFTLSKALGKPVY